MALPSAQVHSSFMTHGADIARNPSLTSHEVDIVQRSSLTSREAEIACERSWWSEAMRSLIQQQLAEQTRQLQGSLAEEAWNQTQQLQSCVPDPLAEVVRSAVRAELADVLAEDGYMRHAMRSEVEAALQSRVSKTTSKPNLPQTLLKKQEKMRDQDSVDAIARQDRPSRTTSRLARNKTVDAVGPAAADHISTFVESINGAITNQLREFQTSQGNDISSFQATLRKAERLWVRLQNLQEPPRPGSFARLVAGPVFEGIVCIAIFLNCAFMVYAINLEVRSPSKTTGSVIIGNWIFQVFYTIEMIMKLMVHRQWFFCNASWKTNTFDCVLVVSGFFAMSTGSSSTGILRILRLLKFGKAIRAIRIMSHMKHLHALLTCIRGSLASLFWSLLMLFIVYAMFSLFLMQIIVAHLEETGEALEDTDFELPFASVERSIVTLYKASTGGDDWGHVYHTIETTGVLGSATFLFFIAFVQFALINIITGIFVESALGVLSPDSEMLALEHNRREQDNAKKLEQLCRNVDEDLSGKLTQEQFEDSLRKKQLPMLLTMLGLGTDHVLELFKHMAQVADDNGQVEIGKFVNSCMLLKGAATNFELQKLHAEIRAAQVTHNQVLQDIVEFLQDVFEGHTAVDC
jgi:hypothetical protein